MKAIFEDGNTAGADRTDIHVCNCYDVIVYPPFGYVDHCDGFGLVPVDDYY